ncbi:MAG: phosphodiesterase [Deltaproteobacteria bacterium]|nr:phosphodiesterase [Deltaproteobacteria bacterium]
MLIVQISDFHLKPEGVLAYDVAETASPLRRTVEHINHLQPMPDAVLITGDLVDEGAFESYQVLREILASLKLPFFMVPGNHDHKAGLREVFPEHRYLNGHVEPDGNKAICYTIEHFPVRLIGLDTVIPGEHGGGLNPGRLSWLDRVLSEKPDAPTVIFMHHPPFASGIGHMDKEVFAGRKELASIIGKHPQVERITCGHIHRAISRRFAGTTATVCPGVGMQLVLDLREEASSAFILEPPALMLHFFTELWGEKTLLTHVSIIEDHPLQYGGAHPFFDVVSPG